MLPTHKAKVKFNLTHPHPPKVQTKSSNFRTPPVLLRLPHSKTYYQTNATPTTQRQDNHNTISAQQLKKSTSFTSLRTNENILFLSAYPKVRVWLWSHYNSQVDSAEFPDPIHICDQRHQAGHLLY